MERLIGEAAKAWGCLSPPSVAGRQRAGSLPNIPLAAIAVTTWQNCAPSGSTLPILLIGVPSPTLAFPATTKRMTWNGKSFRVLRHQQPHTLGNGRVGCQAECALGRFMLARQTAGQMPESLEQGLVWLGTDHLFSRGERCQRRYPQSTPSALREMVADRILPEKRNDSRIRTQLDWGCGSR